MYASNVRYIKPQTDLVGINQFISSRLFGTDYDAPGSAPSYKTKLQSVSFGSVCLLIHSGQGCRRGLRRMDHIREDHADHILISMPLRGRSVFSQRGTETQLHPGYFAVLRISDPFSIAIASESNSSEFLQYSVIVPGPMLRSRVPGIDDCCDKAIKITPGAGAIMSSLIDLAAREGEALSEAQSRMFAEMMADAIANCVREAPEMSGCCVKSREHSYARIREQAEYFIKNNLSNPNLSPPRVAEYCKVSPRSLSDAFAAVSLTVVSFIRGARLDGCRAALLSPELAHRSVFEIALHWGFSDPAHFSRAYKARFGRSPRDDRRLKQFDEHSLS